MAAILVVSVAVAVAVFAGAASSTPSLAAQVAQHAGQLSEGECAKAIDAYAYRGQLLVPHDPLSNELQTLLDDLAKQDSIQANTFVSEEIQAGSAEAVWSLANSCSENELPRLNSPGVLIGNNIVKQLDGRVALDSATLGTVRATLFEDADRQVECVHIHSQYGLGGGACSDELTVVAQLSLWFCESSRTADIKRGASRPSGCRSAIPTTQGTVPPALVIVGATNEPKLSVELEDGRLLQETSHAVQGTAKRFFVLPITGTSDASVVAVEGVVDGDSPDSPGTNGATLAPSASLLEE